MSKIMKYPKIVTLKDIAIRCGVSQNTVSVALRGKAGEVSAAVTEQIMNVASELGYDPMHNDGARRLVKRRSGEVSIKQVIGLLFPPRFSHVKYFTTLLQGILDVCTDEGFGLLTFYLPNKPPFSLPPIFGRGDIDAIISYGHHKVLQSLVSQLRHNPVYGPRPIVSLIRPCNECSAVLTDDVAGAEILASHLLALGHRHIVYFRGIEEDYTVIQRLKGIHQAFKSYGLDPSIYLHMIIIDYDIPYNQGVIEPLLAMLHDKNEITAIMAPHDWLARFIYKGLLKEGYQIPDDLSLVGYDDIEEIEDMNGENILTTVHVPLEDIGKTAAIRAITMAREHLTSIEEHCFQPKLVIRSSTASPR